jgi:hypothetical protein
VIDTGKMSELVTPHDQYGIGNIEATIYVSSHPIPSIPASVVDNVPFQQMTKRDISL